MVTTDLEQSIQDKYPTEVNSQANELGGFFFFFFSLLHLYCSTQHFDLQNPELHFSEKDQYIDS